MVFDNAFAGAENNYILSPRGANDKDIWKEGLALVKKNAKPTSAVAAAASNVKNITTAIVKAATSSAPKSEAPAKPAAPKTPNSEANTPPTSAKSPTIPAQPIALPAYIGEKSYKSVKSLHRSQFLHALSSIAFPGKSCKIDKEWISLVESEGKNHVALKFLKENGGIWSSELSLKDKVYLSAFGGK